MNRLRLTNLIRQEHRQYQAKVEDGRHHQAHAKAAWQYIEDVERHNGWKLTNAVRKQADEYAVRVFGSKEYAPWLYFFSLYSREFKEGLIPLNYYARYVLPDSSLTRISSVKTFSRIALKTDVLPDIGYFLNSKFYNRDFTIMPLHDLRRLIEEKYGEVIVKRDNSLRGMNNYILGVDQITLETFESIGDCVIQYFVKEHDFFTKIVEGSTATIRIVTVRNLKGEIEYRGSLLNLGRKDVKIYRSDIGIRVPIMDEFGLLNKFCYGHDFQQFNAHPDTGVGFENKKIPRFSDAVNFCLKLHKTIPHFPIIGWDVTIDHQENIKLLEWNAGAPHPGIITLQLINGPCFRGLGWEELRY